MSEHTAYCFTCRDEALISDKGTCVWCDAARDIPVVDPRIDRERTADAGENQQRSQGIRTENPSDVVRELGVEH